MSATVDLIGVSADSARTQLAGLLDDALDQWAVARQSGVTLLDHMVEQVSVAPDRRTQSSDTDFSQLLDL